MGSGLDHQGSQALKSGHEKKKKKSGHEFSYGKSLNKNLNSCGQRNKSK